MAQSKGQKTSKRGANPIGDDGWEDLSGTSQELQVGEQCIGKFMGIVRTMSSRKKGEKIPFFGVGDRQLLGGTVLKRIIEDNKVMVGDLLEVTRLEDGTAKKGQNAPKLYRVRVQRKTART